MGFHPRIVLVPLALIAVVLVAIEVVSGTSTRTTTTHNTPAPPAVRTPAWPAPALHNPETVQVTDGNTNLRLDPQRDYVLRLPRDRPVQAPAGLTIAGGHNVVLVGGTVNVPGHSGAALLEGQTGTIHVEGVRFTGPELMEGFDLSESAGATVQLENIYVAMIHGSYTTNHADLIQTWAGPRRLRVDGFVGSTGYQGFFLLPNQAAHFSGPAPELFDLRNVYINDPDGAYALWLQSTPRVPLHLENVVVSPNRRQNSRDFWFWPKPSTGDRSWANVQVAGAAPTAATAAARPAGLTYPR